MKNKDRKEINIKITLGWVISVRRHDLGYTQHKMARAVGMNEIGKIYPEFRKEVEKETDDIGPTLQ